MEDQFNLVSPSGISEWKMCVPFVRLYQFRAVLFRSSLILSSTKRIVDRNRTGASFTRWNFPFGIGCIHLPQLSTNRFSDNQTSILVSGIFIVVKPNCCLQSKGNLAFHDAKKNVQRIYPCHALK